MCLHVTVFVPCGIVGGCCWRRGRSLAAPGDNFWPQWRGPLGDRRVARPRSRPIEWSESKNVRWKVEMPGRGTVDAGDLGRPRLRPDRGAVGVELAASHDSRGTTGQRVPHRMMVMALDRKTGKTVWERTAREEDAARGLPPAVRHLGVGSAVTDGEVIIASFESRGIYAYDMNGKQLWSVDLGDKQMRNEFGEGSTPALHKDKRRRRLGPPGRVVHRRARQARPGRKLWRKNREEIDSWATPLVVEHAGRAQVDHRRA